MHEVWLCKNVPDVFTLVEFDNTQCRTTHTTRQRTDTDPHTHPQGWRERKGREWIRVKTGHSRIRIRIRQIEHAVRVNERADAPSDNDADSRYQTAVASRRYVAASRDVIAVTSCWTMTSLPPLPTTANRRLRGRRNVSKYIAQPVDRVYCDKNQYILTF